MKISNLKINHFGKLSNKEIELKQGINIIYGKNESGKSTLLKFITGMFYGLSKNKNGRFIPDYERYTPWDGGEFSGKISYELDDGKKYEVFRDFKKKNPHIFNEELEDISSNFNIDKSTGNKFFYDQTGVDEELFCSTIVSLQEEVKLDEKEQNTLVQKMSNIASTGEDNVSFQKIMTKLNKKQMEEIGTPRSQDRPINIVTKRMEEIQNEKENLSQFSTKQNEIEEQRKQLEDTIKEEENKLELLKKLKTLQEKQEIEKEKLKINENVIKEYDKKIAKLQQEESEQENQKLMLQTKSNKKNFKIEMILSILFLIISIISLCIIKNNIISAICIVLTIVFAILAGYKQYRKKIETISKETTKEVQTSQNQNEIDILTNAIIKLQKEMKVTTEKLNKEYKEEIERIRNEYLGIIPIKTIDEMLEKQSVQYEVTMLQNKVSEDKVKLHSISNDKNIISSKLEHLVELEEEYTALEEQYEELSKNNELINLAKTEIEKAYDIMKKNVTPKFTNNLSNIIQKISSRKIQKCTTR